MFKILLIFFIFLYFGDCLMCYNCTGSSDKFTSDKDTPCVYISVNSSSELTYECGHDQVCVQFTARKIMNVPLDRSVPMHYVRRGCVDWREGVQDFDYCDQFSSDVVHYTLFFGGRHKYYFYETTCFACSSDLCNNSETVKTSFLTSLVIIVVNYINL